MTKMFSMVFKAIFFLFYGIVTGRYQKAEYDTAHLDLSSQIVEKADFNAELSKRVQNGYTHSFVRIVRNPSHYLQMKKIGLEIPESTRKDMEYYDNIPSERLSPFIKTLLVDNASKSRRRRILIACASNEFEFSSTECRPCTTIDLYCSTCTSTACTTCNTGFKKYAGDSKLCLPQCPNGEVLGICAACPSSYRIAKWSMSNATCDITCSAANYTSSTRVTCYNCNSGAVPCWMSPYGNIKSAGCTSGYGFYSYSTSSYCLASYTTPCGLGSFRSSASCQSNTVEKFTNEVDLSPITQFPIGRWVPQQYSGVEGGIYATSSSQPITLTNCEPGYALFGFYCLKPNGSKLILPSNHTLTTYSSLYMNDSYVQQEPGCMFRHYGLAQELLNTAYTGPLYLHYLRCQWCSLGNVFDSFGTCTLPSCRADQIRLSGICVTGPEPNCIAVDPTTSQCTQCADYYYLTASNTCDSCLSQCTKCTSATICTLCAPGKYKSSSQCSFGCPIRTSYNGVTCVPGTIAGCYSYNDAGTCNGCEVGYMLVGTRCLPECPMTSYYNTTSTVCAPCVSGCNICTGPTAALCTSWGFYSTYPAANFFITCSSNINCSHIKNCAKCYNPTPSLNNRSCLCLEANPGYYLLGYMSPVKYVKQCSQGNYYNNVTDSCEPCHFACSDCFGPTNANCTTCQDSYFAFHNACIPINTTCSIYNGFTHDLDLNVCVSCSDVNCAMCGHRSICDHCKFGYRVFSDNPASRYCALCPTGQNTCGQYLISVGKALSCKPGYYRVSTSTTCVKVYREGYAYTGSPCDESCRGCYSTTITSCDSCLPGDEINYVSNSCYQNKKVSLGAYVWTGADIVPCTLPCLTCTGSSPFNCTSCRIGAYLVGSMCITCADRCLTCSGAASNCTSCHMGYTYDGALGTCTAVCERYEYLDTASGDCVPCSLECRTCTPNNTCLSCPIGTYLVSGRCKPCHDRCAKCSGPLFTDCSDCHSMYIMNITTNRCESSCPVGSFWNRTIRRTVCQACHTSCSACVGPAMQNCTGCQTGYSLVLTPNNDQNASNVGYCLKNCLDGTYAQFPYPNECTACHPYCLTCKGPSASECLTCKRRYFLRGSTCYQCNPSCATGCSGWLATECRGCTSSQEWSNILGRCVPKCPSLGYFINNATNICETCHQDCISCIGPLETDCIACELPKPFLQKNKTCGLTFFIPCMINCSTCVNTTEAGCTSCDPGYLLMPNGSCVSTCPLQYYIYLGTACKPCYANCEECSNSSSNSCTSCNTTTRYLNNGSCLLNCPQGTFYNISLDTCQVCASNCSSCLNSTDQGCLACMPGKFMYPNKSCQSQCSSGFYLVNGTSCMPCDITCESCNGSTNRQCISCNPATRTLNASKVCEKNCPTGSFYIETTDSCSSCATNCQLCVNITVPGCTSCIASYFMMPDKSCVGVCPTTYFNSTPTDCSLCHSSNCSSCTNSTLAGCQTCINSYLMLPNRTCLASCPPGYYNYDSTSCHSCHATCLTCNGGDYNNCLSCSAARLLNLTSSTCDLACTVGTFYNSTADACELCASNCATCIGQLPAQCLTCLPTYLKMPTQVCVPACPSGYFNGTLTSCLPCHDSCLNCTSSDRFHCTACNPLRTLDASGGCFLACLSSQYYHIPADQCYQCHEDCHTCAGGSATDCISCVQGKFIGPDKTCVSQCPLNTVKVGFECIKCYETCASCSGALATLCLTCKAGYVLLESGACSGSCDPKQFVMNGTTCVDCSPLCDTCLGPGVTECLECVNVSTVIKSESGECVDCGGPSALTDTKTCWFVSSPVLLAASQKSVNVRASATLRVTFPGEQTFGDRLTPELLVAALNIEVSGISGAKPRIEVNRRNGEYLMDLFFENGSQGSATVTITPKRGTVISNSITKKAELIFGEQASIMPVNVITAPNQNAVAALEGSAAALAGSAAAIQTFSNVLSLVMIFLGSAAGAVVMKIARVLKAMSRLRLVNVNFGVYLELFLQSVGGLFPIGGHTRTIQWLQVAPNWRGKLDIYNVTVFSIDGAALPIAALFVILVARYFREKVRKYVTKPEHLLRADAIVDSLAEQGRTMVMGVFGIDVFFYSLRTLSHTTLGRPKGFEHSLSIILSLLAISSLMMDMLMALDDNRKTVFAAIRLRLRRDLRDEARNLRKQLELQGGTAISMVDIYKQSINKSRVIAVNKSHNDVIKVRQLQPQLREYIGKSEELKKNVINSSLEQFFGNGIKLHKLRTPEGRYYNSFSLMKLFLFEPIFVGLQTIPGLQVCTLFLLQFGFVYFLIRAGFIVKIFDRMASFASILLTEVSVMLLLLLGVLLHTTPYIPQAIGDAMQFGLIILLGLSTLAGMIEFAMDTVLNVRKFVQLRQLSKFRKAEISVKEEQGLVRHRVIGRDLPGAEPPVPPVDADMSSSVADIKANQVGQSAKPVLGKTRLAPGKRLSRPPLQPLARK